MPTFKRYHKVIYRDLPNVGKLNKEGIDSIVSQCGMETCRAFVDCNPDFKQTCEIHTIVWIIESKSGKEHILIHEATFNPVDEKRSKTKKTRKPCKK